MPRYRIEILRTAEEDLASLPKKIQGQIARGIDRLAEDPRPDGCEPVRGSPDLLRIRSGDCRVLYRVKDSALIVLVVKIGPRKDVCRGV